MLGGIAWAITARRPAVKARVPIIGLPKVGRRGRPMWAARGSLGYSVFDPVGNTRCTGSQQTIVASALSPLGSGLLDQHLSPSLHRRLITHQRNATPPRCGARPDTGTLEEVGIIEM